MNKKIAQLVIYCIVIFVIIIITLTDIIPFVIAACVFYYVCCIFRMAPEVSITIALFIWYILNRWIINFIKTTLYVTRTFNCLNEKRLEEITKLSLRYKSKGVREIIRDEFDLHGEEVK